MVLSSIGTLVTVNSHISSKFYKFSTNANDYNIIQLDRESWLTDAAKHCNPNLMVTPSMKNNAFGAITRIDLSHNSLTTIASEIFYLCSLR